MTDKIPADLTPEEVEAAREWATSYLRGFYKPGHVDAAARALTALLPTPPLPTLADMTDEERDACTGMQADEATGERVIIIDGTDRPDGRVEVLHGEIYVYCPLATEVTPRPDLPRLEWPSDKEPDTSDTVPPNTVAVGSVWGDADALTAACRESGRDQIAVTDKDGYVSVWEASAEYWHGPHPIPQYAPFAIIHPGKKGAGQ